MRYTLTSATGPARRLFKAEEVYDDRDIVRLAKRAGLTVARPNGDSHRIRGSSRLNVWISGDRIVAKFERQQVKEEQSIKPEQVAVVRGKLI